MKIYNLLFATIFACLMLLAIDKKLHKDKEIDKVASLSSKDMVCYQSTDYDSIKAALLDCVGDECNRLCILIDNTPAIVDFIFIGEKID